MSGPILYATDFSPNSLPALRYASTLAAEANAELYIVHVSEALPTADNPSPLLLSPPAIIEAELSAQKNLEEVKPANGGVRCIRRVLHGDPANEIIQFADENDVELIVIGTHGRSGLLKLLMGSVAEAVVRDASCPVIVVKTPPDGEDGEAADRSK
ncbi:MAG: universal stress protein [Aeoliella sp.]